MTNSCYINVKQDHHVLSKADFLICGRFKTIKGLQIVCAPMRSSELRDRSQSTYCVHNFTQLLHS